MTIVTSNLIDYNNKGSRQLIQRGLGKLTSSIFIVFVQLVFPLWLVSDEIRPTVVCPLDYSVYKLVVGIILIIIDTSEICLCRWKQNQLIFNKQYWDFIEEVNFTSLYHPYRSPESWIIWIPCYLWLNMNTLTPSQCAYDKIQDETSTTSTSTAST